MSRTGGNSYLNGALWDGYDYTRQALPVYSLVRQPGFQADAAASGRSRIGNGAEDTGRADRALSDTVWRRRKVNRRDDQDSREPSSVRQ